MTRRRIALTLDDVENPEVKRSAASLIELHERTSSLTNNLSTQVKAVREQVDGVLARLRETDEDLTELLTKMNSQVSALTDAVLQYQSLQNQGLDLDERFSDSFSYVLKNALVNLERAADALEDRPTAVGLKEEEGEVELSRRLPPPSTGLAPSSLLTTASLKSNVTRRDENTERRVLLLSGRLAALGKQGHRQAGLFGTVIKTVEELQPLLVQLRSVLERNDELLEELQNVFNAVYMSREPSSHEPEEYAPEHVETETETKEQETSDETLNEDLEVNVETEVK